MAFRPRSGADRPIKAGPIWQPADADVVARRAHVQSRPASGIDADRSNNRAAGFYFYETLRDRTNPPFSMLSSVSDHNVNS